MALKNLSLLPADILLYLFQFCGLVDNVALSMVCSSFHKLAQTRGFWINALRNARLITPIACPFHEDLTTHDLQSLRRIVSHTIRLARNWSRPEPQITGPIKTVTISTQPGIQGRLDVIFQVPGTELYVLHSRASGMICAWDVGLGRQVTPAEHISHLILDVSPGQDEPGKFSMGLLTSEAFRTFNKLVIVCLEYGPFGVTLTFPLRHSFTHETSHWAVFMTKEIVGALECSRDFGSSSLHSDQEDRLSIFAINKSSGRQTVIKTDVPRDDFITDFSQSGTSTTNGDIFILVETRSESRVYRCPRSYLPHDDNQDCPPISTLKCDANCASSDWTQQLSDYDFYHYDPEGALSADDFYGVPAVSIHNKDRYSAVSPDVGLQIRFWTRPTRNPEDQNGSYITPRHIVDVAGKLQDSPNSSWSLILLPHTGRKVLMVINVDESPSLQLVNFDVETNQSTISILKLPHFIDIREIYNLSLDDHRGVVTLLHTAGTLHAIPYA